MGDDAKAPDPARRNQRSRQAILDAAVDLLLEVGYAKLTVEAIAARAGVGKQTIYRWWPTKGAILLDVFLDLVRATESVAVPDTGDLAEDLKLGPRAQVQALARPRFAAPYRALLTVIQHDERLAAELRDKLVRPLLAATRERLRTARTAGEIADVDLEVAAEMIYAPMYYRWLLGTGPLSAGYAETAVDLALRALRP
jgi:AcrR family transcriptional regulator